MTKHPSIYICSVVFILLALIACVNAHPDDSGPYDVFDMDELDMFSIGQQFVDFASYAPMVSTRFTTHRKAFVQPSLTVDKGTVFASRISPATPPTMATRPYDSPMGRSEMSFGPSQTRPPSDFDMLQFHDPHAQPYQFNYAQDAVSVPAGLAIAPAHDFVCTMPTMSSAQEIHRRPVVIDQPQYLDSTYDIHPLPPPSTQIMVDWTVPFRQNTTPLDRQSLSVSYPSATVAGPSHIPATQSCPPEISRGAVQSGLEPIYQLNDWLQGTRTTAERVRPQLDTNHLQPQPGTSSEHSPASASTTGSFKVSSTRRRRKQLAMGNYQFTCDECHAGFASQGDLNHHAKKHEPYERRQHVCRLCRSRFRYPKDLARHQQTHDPTASRLLCPMTGCKFATKGFGRPDHLSRHMRTQHPEATPLSRISPQS